MIKGKVDILNKDMIKRFPRMVKEYGEDELFYLLSLVLSQGPVGLIMLYIANELDGTEWPEAEHRIAEDAKASYRYAMLNNRRFKEGEKIICANNRYRLLYLKDVLNVNIESDVDVIRCIGELSAGTYEG